MALKFSPLPGIVPSPNVTPVRKMFRNTNNDNKNNESLNISKEGTKKQVGKKKKATKKTKCDNCVMISCSDKRYCDVDQRLCGSKCIK